MHAKAVACVSAADHHQHAGAGRGAAAAGRQHAGAAARRQPGPLQAAHPPAGHSRLRGARCVDEASWGRDGVEFGVTLPSTLPAPRRNALASTEQWPVCDGRVC